MPKINKFTHVAVVPIGGVVPTGGSVFSKWTCIYPLKKESNQYIYIYRFYRKKKLVDNFR